MNAMPLDRNIGDPTPGPVEPDALIARNSATGAELARLPTTNPVDVAAVVVRAALAQRG